MREGVGQRDAASHAPFLAIPFVTSSFRPKPIYQAFEERAEEKRRQADQRRRQAGEPDRQGG